MNQSESQRYGLVRVFRIPLKRNNFTTHWMCTDVKSGLRKVKFWTILQIWRFRKKILTKNKKVFELQQNGEWRGEGRGVAGFSVQNARIYVRLQLQHHSLRRSAVRPGMWILQIRLGEMITWDKLTIVAHILRSTGPDLWNTCPTRHLKVHISRDTCVGACAAKKHNEFERQTTLSGLLQTTVRLHVGSLLRRYRTW